MYSFRVNNFEKWRSLARELLKRDVPPEQITWTVSQHQLTLGEFDYPHLLAREIKNDQVLIPSEFFSVSELVKCHRDESKWSLLYKLAWRLIKESRQLLQNNADDDVAKLRKMKQAVSRDRHKMKAFIRFQKVDGDELNHKEHFIAWFEPEHLIVQLTAPFFRKRFHNMVWTICTPDECVHWDMHDLVFTQGIQKPPKKHEEMETLWRAYYASIFNPARLKIKAMQSEMPKKYWKNLPEAPLISELIRNAGGTSQKMLLDEPKQPWEKTERSQFVADVQRDLRAKKEL